MNSDEYHSIDRDNESTSYGICRYCARAHGDHENTCPQAEPSGHEDLEALGREEDRWLNIQLGEKWDWPD